MRNAYTSKNSSHGDQQLGRRYRVPKPPSSVSERHALRDRWPTGTPPTAGGRASAVNHPVWMAMTGNTGEMSTQALQPLHVLDAAALAEREHDAPGWRVIMMRPYMATMMWYVWNTKFTGAVSGSRAPYCSVSASVVQALVLGVPGARCQEAGAAGDGERGDDLLALLVHPAEQRTAAEPRRRTCPPSWRASWAALRPRPRPTHAP